MLLPIILVYRYAIGNAERGQGIEPKYGWLDALAEQTHQLYNANNTGGPSIRVNEYAIPSINNCEWTSLSWCCVKLYLSECAVIELCLRHYLVLVGCLYREVSENNL